MGRIPKVERDRALQLQHSTSSLIPQPLDQSSVTVSSSSGRQLAAVTARTPETTMSDGGSVDTGFNVGVNGQCEEKTITNGSVSGLQSGGLHEREEHIQQTRCSNWVSTPVPYL